jgi:hypothetical protein
MLEIANRSEDHPELKYFFGVNSASVETSGYLWNVCRKCRINLAKIGTNGHPDVLSGTAGHSRSSGC